MRTRGTFQFVEGGARERSKRTKQSLSNSANDVELLRFREYVVLSPSRYLSLLLSLRMRFRRRVY